MGVKAVWSGQGEPEGGIYEYGQGTDHPDIPWGIKRQKNEADSNWTFEYSGEENSSLKMHKYLATPVWFYSAGGEEFYTADKTLLPTDAQNVKEGNYADVYRIMSTETRHPTAKSSLADLDKTAFNREKKLMDQLAKTMVTLNPDRSGRSTSVTIIPSAKGEYSLISLYLFALKTGNADLVSMLNNWVGKKTAITFSSADLFSGDRAVSDAMRNAPAFAIADKILGSRTWKELNSNIAKMYVDIQDKMSGNVDEQILPTPAPSTEAIRPVPVEIVQQEIIPPKVTPPPTPAQVMTSRIEFTPEKLADVGVESTDFSREYSAEEIGTGLHYLKNMPDEALSAALMEVSEASKSMLRTFLPGLLKKTGDTYHLAAKNLRNMKPSQPLTKELLVQHIIPALAEFESSLSKKNLEFIITSSASEYSPVITLDFPYMWALGRDSGKAFAAIQGAYRVALLNRMKQSDQQSGTNANGMVNSNTTEDVYGDIQLKSLSAGIVVGAVSDIWQYKTTTKDGQETLTPLGQMVANLVEKTGQSQEEIERKIQSTLNSNLTNLGDLSAKKGISEGYMASKFLQSAGRALGLAVAVHGLGMRSRLLSDKENTLMHTAQGQFGAVLQELFGDRVETSLGDTVTYYPSTEGSQPIQISLGMMQFQHNFMPYYLNTEGDVIAEVAGDEYNISKLEEPKRGQVMDALMSRIGDLCNVKNTGSITSQDAIYFSLQKYQRGVHDEIGEEAVAVFGAKKDISKIPVEKNVHSDTGYLQTAVEVVSSLTNFITTDVESWLKGEVPSNLTPEEVAKADGKQHILVQMAFQRKIDELSIDMPKILDALEITGTLRDTVSDLILDSLGTSRDEARNKMQRRFEEKGKSDLSLSQLGSIMEYTQLLVPALSAIRNATKLGQSVEVVPSAIGGGTFHTDITPEMMAGKPPVEPYDKGAKGQSNFLRNRFSNGGFHIKIDGKDNYFLKEGRTGGYGDLVHISDPQGEANAYPFEGKTGKGSKALEPHIAQVSPMMRFILAATAKSKSVGVGQTGTAYLHYGDKEASGTPLGQMTSKESRASYFVPKYGIPKAIGKTLDFGKLSSVFSSSDGPALICTGYA